MSARPPSLRAISAFEAAARHQSFARAVQELNLTTSAVSHAIKGLETRLRTRLFDRAGRKVRLTPEGQTLAVRVRLSLSLLDDAFDTAPWLRRDRLDCFDSLFDRQPPGPALHDFRPSLPHHRTGPAMRPGTGRPRRRRNRHRHPLRPGRLDRPSSPLSWRRAPFSPSPARPYRGGDLPRSLKELRACTLIRHPESTCELWLHPLNCDPNDFPSSLTIDDLGVALEVARQSGGVALARSWLVREDLKARPPRPPVRR